MALQPAGVFAETYAADRRLFKTRPQRICLALLLLALALAPVLLGPRLVAAVDVMLITAVAVIGLQITTGYAGQINLGQSAFMGVGAYAAAVLGGAGALPFWLAIPLGGIAAALFGVVFGLAAVRIKGFYLALTSIAAQFVFAFAVLNLPAAWLGQSKGLSLAPARLFGVSFTDDASLYYLLLTAALIMVWGAFGIVRSRHGRAFVAVRDDEAAAGLTGVNVVATKIAAFMVGSFYAGVAGALWAYYLRYVSVEQFTLIQSVWLVGMIIVGGMGSIVGALVGVVFVQTLNEAITSLGPSLVALLPGVAGDAVFTAINLVLGGVLAAFLLLEPKGLMHRWNLLKAGYRLWPYPH